MIGAKNTLDTVLVKAPHRKQTYTEQELEEFVKTEHLAVHAVDNMAQGLPAFGIVAAVMGVVQTMGSIGLPPAELGKLIGAALVGTFLGILFSYAVVAPMASAMGQRGELEIKSLFAVKAILLASLNGFTPPYLQLR